MPLSNPQSLEPSPPESNPLEPRLDRQSVNLKQVVAGLASVFLASGCLILLVISPILAKSDRLVIFTIAATCLGLGGARFFAKRLLRLRSFLPISALIKFASIVFFLTLLILIKSQQLLAIAAIWQVVGFTFLGMGICLCWERGFKQAITHMQMLTNDGQVVIHPSLLSQEVQQCYGAIALIMAIFVWSAMELPTAIQAAIAITLTMTGVTNLYTWRIIFWSDQRLLSLGFEGLWGQSATYALDLQSFNYLEKIKLQEGDLRWVQLSGYGKDVTLPLTMFESQTASDQIYDYLVQSTHLAKQDSVRDSLRLIGILLPLGAGTLAGMVLVLIGTLLCFLLRLPPETSWESGMLLLGVSLVCPWVGRSLFKLLAPKILKPTVQKNSFQLQAWEIGLAILLIPLLSTVTGVIPGAISGAIATELLGLTGAWLTLGTGICLLALVPRTPIISRD
jgi:hypothetical protein